MEREPEPTRTEQTEHRAKEEGEKKKKTTTTTKKERTLLTIDVMAPAGSILSATGCVLVGRTAGRYDVGMYGTSRL